MGYTLQDLTGLMVATLLCVPLLVLPGFAVGHISNAFGFRTLSPARSWAWALLLAISVLPGLDAIVITRIGLDATLALHLALAAYGYAAAWRTGLLALSRGWWIAAAAWFAATAAMTVDFDWNGALHASLLRVDMVKHAATVRALVEAGRGPPPDVLFFSAISPQAITIIFISCLRSWNA